MSQDQSELPAPLSPNPDSPEVSANTKAAKPVKAKPQGLRKNGKQWHNTTPKTAFRPSSSTSTINPSTSSKKQSLAFLQRQIQRQAASATKATEASLKADKDAERKAHVDRILGRRKDREEKERQRVVQEKMSVRKRERIRRREKRNKLLHS